MAFDKPTRNRLANFVSEARRLIVEEFTEQFTSLYGISENGSLTPLDQLRHLDDTGRATACMLRERIDYLIKTHPGVKDGAGAGAARLAREQAFTVLNRLAAIRMAEKRGIIVESVGKGYQSKGFKVFEQVAGSGLGDTYHRYRRYLFCLFDELAVDLGLLFDRRSHQGLLFPREPALQELLSLLNAPDLDALWAEDETIGWIYQYYNDPAERKKMREESAAPRNSRELAVRNQFFTPRYVVEFLTDNTLGRIWYEMRQGQTRLKDQCRYLVRRPTEIFLKPGEIAPVSPHQDGLSQEELLKQPVHIPHRPIKDPREIRMLDPACGSMHFGLYAFDLFEVIYEEAWDFGMESLRRDFPDKDAFLREVPRLIIQHNIHGIDIDPRAVQIAGLSLWLRAQKSWQAQRVPAAQRPRILRSNIVCAEPMPGSPELLREFSATLNPPLLGQLVEKVFAHMQLAGEAGSLLKIEEEIATLVKDAKKLWQSRPQAEQLKMGFALKTEPKQGNLPLDISGISEDRFWETAEERIYAALRSYAEHAEFGAYQRRLFAEDAARGFAFIDLCRNRYDVVLMNPPFGEPTLGSKAYLDSWYPRTKNDVYAAFTERWLARASVTGRLGAITSRTGFFLSHFQRWREEVLLADAPPVVTADLGYGVLDAAMVETAAYCLESRTPSKTALFFGLLFQEHKGRFLHETLQALASGHKTQAVYIVNPADFRNIPRSPFAYWASQRCVSLFSGNPGLESMGYRVRKGLDTNDDFRFFRLWWEVPLWHQRYVPLAKGGAFARYYSEISLVFDWSNNGEHLRAFLRHRGDHPSRNIRSEELYFLPGLTWSQRSQKGLSVRLLPSGCIFSTKGPGIIPQTLEDAFEMLGLLNSSAYAALVGLQMAFGSYDTGVLKLTPLPKKECGIDSAIATSAKCALNLSRRPFMHDESARRFAFPALILGKGSISDRFVALRDYDAARRSKLTFCQEQIDRISIELYGLDESSISTQKKALPGLHSGYDPDDSTEEEEQGLEAKGEIALSTSLREILGFSLGTAFGRWDIRFATGEKPPPELPDPFAPLPVCPPGQLQNDQGLPITKEEVGRLKDEDRWNYPIGIPWDGILVNDPDHSLDLEARVHHVLQVIWKDRWEAIEREVCETLGVGSLRDYFCKPAGFFADHLKRYSKSRRQAPIYWPLSTAKGNYTLWIYYHRLTDQTLHTALADFVDPKLKSVRAEISSLRESGNYRDRLEELQDLERELEEFRAEIERIIKLPWKPNLNDGVLITASPLWKLFRLPKWQKDLKACWEKLKKGDYDWAHLAYSIWPKRVEEVCKHDRSIAIVHNLERLCKIEPPKPKARRGKKKTVGPELELMED